jgi:hypothetical protein
MSDEKTTTKEITSETKTKTGWDGTVKTDSTGEPIKETKTKVETTEKKD